MASFLKKSIAALPLKLRLALAPKISGVPQTIADNSFRTWIAAYIHPAVRFFADKSDLEQFVCDRFRATPIAWYGFGGDSRSLSTWTGINTNADSRFYAFSGAIYPANDQRARLIGGDCTRTLPENRRLFQTSVPKLIHLQTGTFDETLFVLHAIGETIDTRAIVMIENFANLENAFKALAAYGRPYLVLGATSFFTHLAIRFAPR